MSKAPKYPGVLFVNGKRIRCQTVNVEYDWKGGRIFTTAEAVSQIPIKSMKKYKKMIKQLI